MQAFNFGLKFFDTLERCDCCLLEYVIRIASWTKHGNNSVSLSGTHIS